MDASSLIYFGSTIRLHKGYVNGIYKRPLGEAAAREKPLRGVIGYLGRYAALSVIGYLLSGALRGGSRCAGEAASRRYRLSVIGYLGRCAASSVICYRLAVHLSAVADGEGQDNQLAVLNIAEHR